MPDIYIQKKIKPNIYFVLEERWGKQEKETEKKKGRRAEKGEEEEDERPARIGASTTHIAAQVGLLQSFFPSLFLLLIHPLHPPALTLPLERTVTKSVSADTDYLADLYRYRCDILLCRDRNQLPVKYQFGHGPYQYYVSANILNNAEVGLGLTQPTQLNLRGTESLPSPKL